MANDKLLKELDLLSDAYNIYKKELNSKKGTNDFLINMPVAPVEPEKSEILKKYPSGFDFWKIPEMSSYKFEKMKDPGDFSSFLKMVGWCLLATALFWIPALIVVFTTKGVSAIVAKVFLIFVAIVVVGLFVGRIIYCNVYFKRKCKAYDEHVEEIKKYNESIAPEVKEYNEETKKYNIACEKYKESKTAYDIEYSRLYKIAEEQCSEYNDLIETVARKKFDTVLAGLSFDYPSDYFYAISNIRSIIKESRANYVSAAIIVYKKDREEEERINSERRAREAIEEREQALKRKEYKEEERIRQLRANCWRCIHSRDCDVIDTLTSVCPLFRQR